VHSSAVPAVLGIFDFEKVPFFTYDEGILEPVPDYPADHAQFDHGYMCRGSEYINVPEMEHGCIRGL